MSRPSASNRGSAEWSSANTAQQDNPRFARIRKQWLRQEQLQSRCFVGPSVRGYGRDDDELIARDLVEVHAGLRQRPGRSGKFLITRDRQNRFVSP
jgi:hypothetical protein